MCKLLGLSALAICFAAVPLFAQSSCRDVQQALVNKGYDTGGVDGICGAKTHQALRDYQRKNNLTESGDMDDATLDSLGVRHAAAGTEFHESGSAIKHSYSNGGKEVGHGGKALGHDVKNGHPVEGAKDLGKGVGNGAKDVGVGTAHAAKDAAKGVKNGVMNDKHDTNTRHQ